MIENFTDLNNKVFDALEGMGLAVDLVSVNRLNALWVCYCGEKVGYYYYKTYLRIVYISKEKRFKLSSNPDNKLLYYGNDFDDLVEEIKIYANRKDIKL